MGACGGTGPHKNKRLQREISSEGCMCLMSVFPIWLEIIIWSRKPQENHLHNGASGKCLCPPESQQTKKCVRALGFAQVLVGHKAQYSWSGVNRAVNNLPFLSSPNVSVALNCFCRPFYVSQPPCPDCCHFNSAVRSTRDRQCILYMGDFTVSRQFLVSSSRSLLCCFSLPMF